MASTIEVSLKPKPELADLRPYVVDPDKCNNSKKRPVL